MIRRPAVSGTDDPIARHGGREERTIFPVAVPFLHKSIQHAPVQNAYCVPYGGVFVRLARGKRTEPYSLSEDSSAVSGVSAFKVSLV